MSKKRKLTKKQEKTIRAILEHLDLKMKDTEDLIETMVSILETEYYSEEDLRLLSELEEELD